MRVTRAASPEPSPARRDRTLVRADRRRRDAGARRPDLLRRRHRLARARRDHRSGDRRRQRSSSSASPDWPCASRAAFVYVGVELVVADGAAGPRAVRPALGLLRAVRGADGRPDAGQATPPHPRRPRRRRPGFHRVSE